MTTTGIIRNARTHTARSRSWMSEVTDSLVKNWAKNSRHNNAKGAATKGFDTDARPFVPWRVGAAFFPPADRGLVHREGVRPLFRLQTLPDERALMCARNRAH